MKGVALEQPYKLASFMVKNSHEIDLLELLELLTKIVWLLRASYLLTAGATDFAFYQEIVFSWLK